MLRNTFLRALRDRRRSLLFWGVGLALLSVMMILIYPAIRDAPGIAEYLEVLPEELLALFAGEVVDYTTPEGFLNGELFFLMFPLLLLVFGIGFGASLAGEEENGTLELLLANPIPRWRLVVDRFAAMTVSFLLLGAVSWATLAIGSEAIDMGLDLARLAAVIFSASLLGTVHGSFALAAGCLRGRRGLAIGIASALAVYGYLLNALAPLIDWLEPFRGLSAFYYYSAANPLSNGLDAGHAGVLLGLTALFLAAAIISFQRRDLAV
jgi:ABC-2 type transport system permease protein